MSGISTSGSRVPATGRWTDEHGHVVRLMQGDSFPRCRREEVEWDFVEDIDGE